MTVVGSLLVWVASDPAPAPQPGPGSQLAKVATQIGERQESAPLWIVVLTGLMGILVAFGFRASWHVATAAHEGAHASVASFAGGRVTGVQLNRNGGGLTTYTLKGRTDPLVKFAGYVGPSIFGLFGAALLGSDRVVIMLVVATVLSFMLLTTVRNVFGWVVGTLVFLALASVTWSAGLALQQVTAYTLVWFLLAVGMPVLFALQGARRKMTPAKRKKSGSDVDELRKQTGVPGVIWVWLQVSVCVASLYFGARLMLF